MPQPKDDFERVAPTLLQGNLWRKYLSSRKNKPEPLEQILKAFFKEPLEVDKAFPEINGQLLATLSVTQLAGKAFEKLQTYFKALEKLPWYAVLEGYLAQTQQHVSQLEEKLAEFSKLGNKLATTKVGQKPLPDAILCHQEYSERGLSDLQAYQDFARNARDEHYSLLLEFLKISQAIETLFTDLVLLNKAFTTGFSSALSILKDETYISQHLSNTAFILMLNFNKQSVLTLANDPQPSSLHPSLFLKKLSSDEWELLVCREIGLELSAFAKALYQEPSAILEFFPNSAALKLFERDFRLIAQAVLSNPRWIDKSSDDEFMRAMFTLCDDDIITLLSNAAYKGKFCQRLTAILNDDCKRNIFLTHPWHRQFKVSERDWLADTLILEALSDAAFQDCLIQIDHQDSNKLISQHPNILKRLEIFDGHQLIELIERHVNSRHFVTSAYLKQPSLLAKFNTDELLTRAVRILDRKLVNPLRKANADFDKRLTGPFIINLILLEPIIADFLYDNEELYQRFGINEIHTYLVRGNFPSNNIKYFLQQKDILSKFSNQQLFDIKFTAYYIKEYENKQNDIIAEELIKRRTLQLRVAPSTRHEPSHVASSPVIATNASRNASPLSPTTLDVVKPIAANGYSSETTKDQPFSYRTLAQSIFLVSSLLLVVGLGAAILLSAPLTLLYVLNAALLSTMVFSIGLHTVELFSPRTRLVTEPTLPIRTHKDREMVNGTTQLPKHHPHPATRQPHLGTPVPTPASPAPTASYQAPKQVI